MFGEIAANRLYSFDPERLKDFTDAFISFSRGVMSFPLNIPGTTFYNCLKVRNLILF